MYFNLFSKFLTQLFKIIKEKKIELARGPINTGKIQISEGTRSFVRITEHFKLLDFELVSLDCSSLYTLVAQYSTNFRTF